MAQSTSKTRALERLALGIAGTPPAMLGSAVATPLAAPIALSEAMPETEGVAISRLPQPTEAPQPSEFERLIEQARKQRAATEIARAGAMVNEAITGAKAPMSLYDRYAEEAQRPVVEFSERLELERRNRDLQQGKAFGDPLSDESQRYQGAVAAFSPELAKRLKLDTTRYARTDLESLLKGATTLDQVSLRGKTLAQSERRLDLAEKEATSRQEDRDLDRALREKEMELKERLGIANLDLERQGLLRRLALAELGLVAKSEEKERKAQEKAETYEDQVRVPGLVRTVDAPKIKIETAQKVRDALAVQRSMIDAIDEMVALKKEFGSEINPLSAAYQRMGSLRTSLLTMMKEAEQLGALDAGVERVASGQLPAEKTPEAQAVAKLQEWRKNLENKFGNYINANGYARPGDAAANRPTPPSGGQKTTPVTGAGVNLPAPEMSAKDREAYDWALKNKDNPKAGAILDRLRSRGVIK